MVTPVGEVQGTHSALGGDSPGQGAQQQLSYLGTGHVEMVKGNCEDHRSVSDAWSTGSCTPSPPWTAPAHSSGAARLLRWLHHGRAVLCQLVLIKRSVVGTAPK